MLLPVFFPSIIPGLLGDLLAGEYFLEIGGMILRVTDKDDVRERHFNGITIDDVQTLTQKYYNPFTETEIDYKPATGKEILCYLIGKRTGGGLGGAGFKVWANTTKDSKVSARDVFSTTFATGTGSISTPPFILKAGEFLNIEKTSGDAINDIQVTKIVGVERDAT